MVGNVMNNAMTGLYAASKRLENSANNVANMGSTTSRINGETVNTPFKPQQVTQTSLSMGGVRADLRPVEPSSMSRYDPTNVAADAEGITEYPNVDLEEEIVNQQLASYDYKANLKSIEAYKEMTDELTDILA